MLAKSKLFFTAAVISGVGFTALAQDLVEGPEFNEDGSVVRPIDWETWVFVGSPLTPNALNGGRATFQEFHSVYIEPTAFQHFKDTGEFANGTQLAKVRTYLYGGDDCFDQSEENGSCQAVSGRGYFNGEYSGFELTVKDTERFEDPGGWVYYNFGESPQEWADSAQPFPAASCNACHDASAANDFVFTQFYPVLRDSEPKVSDSRTKAGEDEASNTSGEDSEGTRTMQSAAVVPPVSTNIDELFAYLQSGRYRNEFPLAEPEPHPSAGPHVSYGKPVQAYFSAGVAESLEAGDMTHPMGSMIVKDLFSDDGSELIGWAVMQKTHEDSDNGKGWFWAEFLSTEDSSDVPVPAENGSALCTSCHIRGTDFVLSELPD